MNMDLHQVYLCRIYTLLLLTIIVAPSFLQFNKNNNPCPGQVPLSTSRESVSVFLYDDFNTLVYGNVIDIYPVSVYLHNSAINETFHQFLNDTSGSSLFNTTICGVNNSTMVLNFTAAFEVTPAVSIESIACSIIVEGCLNGYEIEDNDCDTCSNNCNSNTICGLVSQDEETNSFFIIALLVFIIVTLSLVLCVSFTIVYIRNYKQRKEQERLDALEIPDFSDNSPLTLDGSYLTSFIV